MQTYIVPILYWHMSTLPIKAIIFDFGGVLGKANKNVIIDFLKESLSLSDADLPILLHAYKQHKQEKLPEDLFWKNFSDTKGLKLSKEWKDNLQKAKYACVAIDSAMITLVKDLKSLGYTVGMFSNVKAHEAAIVKQTGIYEYFDPVILSCNIGAEKPHLDAYEAMLKTLNYPAKQCFFIDDKLENVQAAHQLQINAVAFSTHNELINDLKKHTIL